MGKVLNPNATWYEGEGRLLAQWVFGRVYPLANLNGEIHDDLLQVARLLNKHLSQKRIVTMIDIIADGIEKHNAKALKAEEKKRGKVQNHRK